VWCTINAKCRPGTAAAHLQHLKIAFRIAEGGDRALANVLVDADRLAGAIVDEVDFGETEEGGDVRSHFEARLDARSDDLLGRNTKKPVGPTAA